MSALDREKHGGVFKAAGVVQVGPDHKRARLYMQDAHGYAEGFERTRVRMRRELAREAQENRECAARSCVCAVEALLRWGLS